MRRVTDNCSRCQGYAAAAAAAAARLSRLGSTRRGRPGAAPEAEAALSNRRDAKRATPEPKRESVGRAPHAPVSQNPAETNTTAHPTQRSSDADPSFGPPPPPKPPGPAHARVVDVAYACIGGACIGHRASSDRASKLRPRSGCEIGLITKATIRHRILVSLCILHQVIRAHLRLQCEERMHCILATKEGAGGKR
jgi:hypothetical protein